MKNRKLPLLAAFMLTPIAAGIAQAAPAGRVLMVVGEAAAERAGQKIALKRGTLVEEGDRLTTAAGSSVQVMFTDQGLIALRENTSFKIEKFSFQQGADAANFKLEKGGVRTVTGQVGKASNKDYSLDAVVATIGIRGTNFELVLCEGQCAGNGGSAKNGLYGVVRGASGGTSRITISNDTGEKLLGKNDAFFVADRNTPAQQLVAPPSFVTQRTESSKKGSDKAQDADKKEAGGETKQQSQSDNKSETTASKQDSTSSSQESASGGGTPPATPTAPPVATAFVPPPTNQSLLTTTTQVELTTIAPVLQGGSTSNTPGGTTIATPVAPTPVTPVGQSLVLSVVETQASGLSGYSFSHSPSQVTLDSDGITPVAFSNSSTFVSGGTTYNSTSIFSQGKPENVFRDGRTTVNNLTEYIWGRWGGPAVKVDSTSSINGGPPDISQRSLPDLGTNLHFVSGPLLNKLPAEGQITYKLFGATAPTGNFAGRAPETGIVTHANGSTDIFGTGGGDPILAKVGFNTNALVQPFVLLAPFRASSVLSEDYILVAGAGSHPNAPKPTLLSASNDSPAAFGGRFFGFTSGLYAQIDGSLKYYPGYNSSFSGLLMDTDAGGLGISYTLGLEQGEYVSGAMVLRKDAATLSTPSFSTNNGATSFATFINGSDGNRLATLNSIINGPIETVTSSGGGSAPALFANSEGLLANFGRTSAASTPFVADDNGGSNGYRWGRWVSNAVFGGGTDSNALAGGPVASIRDASGNQATTLHYVTGPALTNLPLTGLSSYSLIGHTVPTSSEGATGSLSLPGGTGNSSAVGLLKASLALQFSGNFNLPPFLRIDSFKITNPTGTSSLILAGNDSLTNYYTPIHLPFQGTAGVYGGGTTQIWGTDSSTPSPVLKNNATASLRGQLMGDGGSGLGLSYSITLPGATVSAPREYIVGSLAFARETAATPVVDTPVGAVAAVATSFAQAIPSAGGPTLQDANFEQRAQGNTIFTLHDGKPVGVVFNGVSGQQAYSIANLASAPAVTIEGADGAYSWGRWNGGNIVGFTAGSPTVQNPIAAVQFVGGPPLSNLPVSGSATYQVQVVGNIPTVTTPISTDGVQRTLFRFDGNTANTISAAVTFGSAGTSTMSLSGIKLSSTDPTKTLFVVGSGTSFSGPSVVNPNALTLTPFGGDPTTGRYVSDNAVVHDGLGNAKQSATALLNGQLMGNAAEGLGVVYTVREPRAGGSINDTTSGAMLLKKFTPAP